METYQHLRIDARELAEALESHLDEGAWLLDLETGEVVFAGAEDEDLAEDENWGDSDRFMAIPAMDPSDGFQIMEDFVDGLPEGEGCRALARALRLPRPFRCFKDTLQDFPTLRQRWFQFHDERVLKYAGEWTEDHLPGAQLFMK
jgi:hypothetical protein